MNADGVPSPPLLSDYCLVSLLFFPGGSPRQGLLSGPWPVIRHITLVGPVRCFPGLAWGLALS